MKASYTRPTLLEYGRLEQLTLGTGGNLPDYLGGQLINNTCPTQTFTGPGGTVVSRTSCENQPPATVGS
jgi:hypothetical protein